MLLRNGGPINNNLVRIRMNAAAALYIAFAKSGRNVYIWSAHEIQLNFKYSYEKSSGGAACWIARVGYVDCCIDTSDAA